MNDRTRENNDWHSVELDRLPSQERKPLLPEEIASFEYLSKNVGQTNIQDIFSMRDSVVNDKSPNHSSLPSSLKTSKKQGKDNYKQMKIELDNSFSQNIEPSLLSRTFRDDSITRNDLKIVKSSPSDLADMGKVNQDSPQKKYRPPLPPEYAYDDSM